MAEKHLLQLLPAHNMLYINPHVRNTYDFSQDFNALMKINVGIVNSEDLGRGPDYLKCKMFPFKCNRSIVKVFSFDYNNTSLHSDSFCPFDINNTT